MIKNWNLAELRQEKKKISGCEVNKVGVYSYQRIRNQKTKLPTKKCYRCDSPFSTMHINESKALKANCSNCKKIGHFAKVCQRKNRKMSLRKQQKWRHQLNIWSIQQSHNLLKFTAVKNVFKKKLFVNCLVKILIDTGAKVSVVSSKLNFGEFMTKWNHPFQKYIGIILHQSKLLVPHYVL